MEIENKKLTPEQNRIAIALRGFKLQYETTSNLDVLTGKLKQFIDNIDILDLTTKLSELYDKISSRELSSKAEICGELERIYEDILGVPMEPKEEKSQSEITQQAENTQDETLTQSNFSANEAATVTAAPQLVKNTMSPKPERTLSEKLKVDVQPVVITKNNDSMSINNNSFSFTRTDGSKITVEVLEPIDSWHYPQLCNCRITQVFPNLPNGSDVEVITNVTTSINLKELQSSPEYKAQLKAALSAQNIYDAAINHNTFLYKGLPSFNFSDEQLLKHTEEKIAKERFTARAPFDTQDGVRKRLLPISEFKGPSPLAFTEYEYSVSGFDLPDSYLKYIYSDIDLDKLYTDSKYKDFILSQIRRAEESQDFNSFFLISSPNLQGEYTAMADITLVRFLEAYQKYVESSQFSTDDGNPGDNR